MLEVRSCGVQGIKEDGRPCPSGLLALDGVGNLKGWQWLFIVEGLPTVLMGVYTLCRLAETPATVRVPCCTLSMFLLCAQSCALTDGESHT